MRQLATDNFFRANENPLSAGGNWTTVTSESANKIVSNLAEGSTASARNGSYFSGIAWPNDQYSEVTVGASIGASDFVAATVRVQSAAESYYFVSAAGSGGCLLGRVDAGANHTLQSFTHTPVVGDVFTIQAVGTTITAFVNGVQVASVTDATYSSGNAGFYTQNAGTLSNAQISKWDAGGSTFISAPQVTTISSTTETQIVTGAAGVSHTLTGLVITTVGTTAATLTLRDSLSGTIRMVIDYPNAAVAPGAPFVLPKEFPGLSQSALGNDWTLQASTAANTYHVTAFYREA